MRYALCGLDADRQFDEEGRSFGDIVPDANISIMIGNDGIDNGEP